MKYFILAFNAILWIDRIIQYSIPFYLLNNYLLNLNYKHSSRYKLTRVYLIGISINIDLDIIKVRKYATETNLCDWDSEWGKRQGQHKIKCQLQNYTANHQPYNFHIYNFSRRHIKNIVYRMFWKIKCNTRHGISNLTCSWYRKQCRICYKIGTFNSNQMYYFHWNA